MEDCGVSLPEKWAPVSAVETDGKLECLFRYDSPTGVAVNVRLVGPTSADGGFDLSTWLAVAGPPFRTYSVGSYETRGAAKRAAESFVELLDAKLAASELSPTTYPDDVFPDVIESFRTDTERPSFRERLERLLSGG